MSPYLELSYISLRHQMMFMFWSDAIGYPLQNKQLQHIILNTSSQNKYVMFEAYIKYKFAVLNDFSHLHILRGAKECTYYLRCKRECNQI